MVAARTAKKQLDFLRPSAPAPDLSSLSRKALGQGYIELALSKTKVVVTFAPGYVCVSVRVT